MQVEVDLKDDVVRDSIVKRTDPRIKHSKDDIDKQLNWLAQEKNKESSSQVRNDQRIELLDKKTAEETSDKNKLISEKNMIYNSKIKAKIIYTFFVRGNSGTVEETEGELFPLNQDGSSCAGGKIGSINELSNSNFLNIVGSAISPYCK